MKIGFTHRADTIGGPGSFQYRLTRELENSGWQAVYPRDGVRPDVILVVGGSRRLFWLLRCKYAGCRIVHRLDGINWRHRVLNVSIVYKIRSEIRNFLARVIRQYLADTVVYQSGFVRDWWNSAYGHARCGSEIIHNLVDLDEFRPRKNISTSPPIILCAESQVINDPISRFIVRVLSERLFVEGKISGIHILGRLGAEETHEWSSLPGVKLIGQVPRDEMPRHFRQADIFLNLDVNAACPNAVIEAMASGLPIVGFRTGALEEMVPESAGALANYGGDPWKLEQPDCEDLVTKICYVIANLEELRRGARSVASARFNARSVVEKYRNILDPREKLNANA